jgi:uncharacterized damage-inducible protein DinB
MDRSFQRQNDESRERLARLAATLTPTQLSIDIGKGWTVASAVGHMGFWDRWQEDRWEDMLAGRWTADSESVLAAEHLANEALHPYWAGTTSTDVCALAVEAATRLDALVASAPDALVGSLEGTPISFLLHRHRHRNEHLDHIERSIAAAADRAAAAAADGQSFAERNAASRRRLAAVVERLRAEDMALPTEPTEEGSWSVAQVLGHMAFWDRSLEVRWRMARDASVAAAADEAAAEAARIEPTYLPGGINEAVNRPLATLIGAWTEKLGLAAGAEAVAAAESLDPLIEELADRLPAGTAAVLPRVLDRSIHRLSHLDQIERALTADRPCTAAPDAGFRVRNDEMRARLAVLAASLTPADLSRPVGDGGWSVGVVLGHMAFWDRFLAARWRSALASGATQPVSVSHEMADLLNDGLVSSWTALAAADPRAVAAEVVAAADEVDSIVSSLPASVRVGVILAERPALLDRSLHRTEHLADLDLALGRR